MMLARTWVIPRDLLIAVALLLLVLAFLASMGWFGVTHWSAWFTAGVAVFVASFMPWRTSP